MEGSAERSADGEKLGWECNCSSSAVILLLVRIHGSRSGKALLRLGTASLSILKLFVHFSSAVRVLWSLLLDISCPEDCSDGRSCAKFLTSGGCWGTQTVLH